MPELVIAKNPEPDTPRPFLLKLPLGDVRYPTVATLFTQGMSCWRRWSASH